jgi:hypothetical protein
MTFGVSMATNHPNIFFKVQITKFLLLVLIGSQNIKGWQKISICISSLLDLAKSSYVWLSFILAKSSYGWSWPMLVGSRILTCLSHVLWFLDQKFQGFPRT